MENQINNETYVNIVTSIVVSAASQVDGIASVTYDPGLTGPANSKKKRESAIEITIFDNNVTIKISINVFYGKVIPIIVCNLQEKIKKEVETSTSLKVKNVNVNVVGIVSA